jgi:prepilin-type N-terminal cleavage/methylation domain-containing protein
MHGTEKMHRTEDSRAGNAGFSLVELMVAMVLVLIIMGGALTGLTNAYRSNESAKAVTGVNNNLRIGIDVMVRDLIQVGQGLPTGRTVQVPSFTGALAIQRPHGAGSACTTFPAVDGKIPAVIPGPGCGPTIENRVTDMVTTLAVDSVLDQVPVQSFNAGAHTATVSTPAQAPGTGKDISVGTADDVRVGDLLMFTKGSMSALVYVTAVDGNQTVTFAGGDPMNLNQFHAPPDEAGTVDDLATTAPVTAQSALVSRIRMISYYLDNTLDPTTPRLIRHMGWGDPAAAVNRRGGTVAFSIETLQFSYDIRDGDTNPSRIRMVAADLVPGGGCLLNPCSPTQIRKVNLFIAGRSAETFSVTRRFYRNSLNTQVSLRSLALRDKYR